MARSMGRTDIHIIPKSDNSLTTPPIAVRETSDMAPVWKRLLLELLLPGSSICYVSSSNCGFRATKVRIVSMPGS